MNMILFKYFNRYDSHRCIFGRYVATICIDDF